MKIEKLNENLDHIEMVDKTYDVVNHTYATAVRDHKSNVERITKMMKERSKDAVQGERQPKTIKNAMLKRMHLSESIFDNTRPLGKQKVHEAKERIWTYDTEDGEEWYDMASFIEDHLSRSDITRPDEQVLNRIARISDTHGVSYKNLGRDKNDWVTATVPLGKYSEDTDEIEISDSEETQASAKARADKVIEAARKIAEMYKLGFDVNKNADEKFYEFKIEVPKDSIGQIYCIGDWFEENGLDLDMALTPAYQKRLAKREQLFANPDKNEEFLSKAKNESLTEDLKYGQTKYEELVGKIREYWDAPAIDNLCDLMKDIDEQAAYDLIYKCAEFLEEHADEAIEDSQKYPIEKPKAKDSTFVSAEDKQPKKDLLTEKDKVDESVVMNEEAKIISDLWSFEPWSGAEETLDKIKDANLMDELDSLLEDMYPDGITETELNDLLRFDDEWVLEALGIAVEDEDEREFFEAIGSRKHTEEKPAVNKLVEAANPNDKSVYYRDIMDYVKDLGYGDLARKIWNNSDIIESKDWKKIFETFGGGPVAEAFIHFGFDPLFGLNEIPNRYMSGSSIKEFEVPQNITKIGSSAFANCSSLESLTIPNSVTSIGSYAFAGCTSLKSLVIPDSVTSIGENAFKGCTGLEEVVLPKGLSLISVELFRGCSSLTSVNLPAGLKQIGVRAFEGCGSLIKLVIPDSVTTIGQEAFSECSAEIVIGENSDLSKIGDWAFYYSGSSKLFIPDGVSELGNGVLENCSASEITLGRGLKSIGDKSLDGCSNLSKLIYRGTKNSWQYIRKYRDFDYYVGVSEVHCSDGILSI